MEVRGYGTLIGLPLAAAGIGLWLAIRKPARAFAGANLAGLLVTPKQMAAARDNKAAAVVKMKVTDFLALTTGADDRREGFAYFKSEALPLSEYNRFSREGEIRIAPFLRVDKATGEVTGHEGRHRAAAILREEGPRATMPVMIQPRPTRWPPPVSDVPAEVVGQFDPNVRVRLPKPIPLFR